MRKMIFTAVCAAVLLFAAGCASAPVAEPTLQELIRDGRTEEAKARFTTRYNINEIDEDGNTALHVAAALNDADLVAFLIINKADIELKNNEGQTPLHVAVQNDAREAAKALVSFGANVFAKDAEDLSALETGFLKSAAYYDIFITTKTSELRDAEDGRTIVHYFVQTKDVRAVETCIKKEIPLSVQDSNGRTPLDIAFEDMEGDAAVLIAAALVMGGAEASASPFDYFATAVASRNVDCRFADGQTPLHIAAINGHSAVESYLLQNGALTNVQDSSGAAPLHEAVRYGRSDIAAMLLEAGANVNARDNIGKTPLLLAVPDAQQKELYGLLLEKQADVSAKDMYGDTVLHMATMTAVPEEILQLLVSAGADVNERNKDGVTPLALAVENGVLPHISFYARNGAQIHSKDKNGATPLMLALKSGEGVLELMLFKDNVRQVDSKGNTPLIVAILNNAPLVRLQYILSITDDVNSRNADGNAALYYAVLQNRQRLGELLLAKDADIFSTNNRNRSPLSLALHAGGSVMDWLVNSKTIRAADGSGNTALHYAAEWELKEAASSLIQKGADTEARNANGETPLFCAAKTDNAAVVDQLVMNGARVDVRDNLGSTPLHVAVRWENPNVARNLVALGVDVDGVNAAGKSPLAEAVSSEMYDMARLLLDLGANPDSRDVAGRTILMDAVRGKNRELVKLLLSYRANPQVQELSGRNAYHEAALSGDIPIIDLVLDAGGNPLSRDKAGETPFSLSMKSGSAVIRAVLGTDRSISDSDGNTPVHAAVKGGGTVKLLSLLIGDGYPIDVRNADGYTPLGIAVEKGDAAVAELLLANGANPFIFIDKKGANPAAIALKKNNDAILESIVKHAGRLSDVHGNTILHYASKTSDAATVKKLLSYGLNADVRNVSGETPYMTAVRWGRSDVADVLSAGAR